MDRSQLQARIDAIDWYHEFDFGNGLKAHSRAPDVEYHRQAWSFIQRNLDTVDFQGKSVLDIGCWDGYWSFEAERRGAASVLATDDHTQNWSVGEGLFLAKELLGSAVEVNDRLSVYNLTTLNRKFDLILFLGVYYHLFDPFYALAQIRHACHPDTIVLIEGAASAALSPSTALYQFQDRSTEWLPTREALEQILGATYFDVRHADSVSMGGAATGQPTVRWRWRVMKELLRGSYLGVREIVRQLGPGHQRLFMKCVPFEGKNETYIYRPPFDLHRYDPRFGEK